MRGRQAAVLVATMAARRDGRADVAQSGFRGSATDGVHQGVQYRTRAITSATAARCSAIRSRSAATAMTLAVGAPNESSGAKGINGNQNDTSVYSAGAVYVFTRRNATSPWAQQAYVKASTPQTGSEFGHVVVVERRRQHDGGFGVFRSQRRARASTAIRPTTRSRRQARCMSSRAAARRGRSRPTSRRRTPARRAPTATSVTAISSASRSR